MKYIINGIIKTKAKWLILAEMVITAGYLWLNAKILLWISYAVSDHDHYRYMIMVAIGCLVNTLLLGFGQLTEVSTHMIFTHLNDIYADKVLDGDVKMFTKFPPGTISHTGGNIWKFSKITNRAIGMVKNALSVAVNVIAIASIAPNQLWYIAIVSIFITLVIWKIKNKWEKLDSEADKTKHLRNVELDEITNGFMEVRSFSGATESHRSSIHSSNGSILGMIIRRQTYSMLLSQSLSMADTICSLLALLYVVTSFESAEPVLPATGLALVMYIWRLGDPFANFVFGFSEFSELKAALPTFVEIMDYESSIEDGNMELDEFEAGISVENIVFGYDKTSTVLDGISMYIPKGAKIGICGPSGGGKSTFLKLLPRFYDVNSGAIKIDGIDIKRLRLSSLRKYIGIVHQQAYIFDGTLRDNIAYGMRPNNPDEYKVVEACKKASLYDFILSLPDGLDTKVGPRGMKLSGGQRQRISLARLFLVNPEIIILDEATSALDNETEAAVQDALKLFEGKTVITVAHRLTTIKDCDTIYVIANHKIAESGSHDELMNLNGIYAEMNKYKN